MTLTTRLSLFFLGTLALVLAGVSGGVYFLAHLHLHRQLDERLNSSMQTLVAAAEIRPNEVEWEPSERVLQVGPAGSPEPVVWRVSDPQQQFVDGSPPKDAQAFLAEASHSLQNRGKDFGRFDWNGHPWRVARRILAASAPRPSPALRGDPKRRTILPSLTLTAAAPLGPMQATLRTLGFTLAGVSLVILVLGTLLSRAVCRRALVPVTSMAQAARSMEASDRRRRLPGSEAGDELADLSRAFNGLLDRLQESFERQRRFTGDASHQLRTPLTALLGQVEVALRRERAPQEYRRVLESARGEALRLRQIVETLLFLARADEDARLPEREKLDLSSWLSSYLQTWAAHPRNSDLRTESDDGELGPVVVQPVLLGELLTNLIENAFKYSEPGTPVTLRLARAGGSVALSVEDRGCGIAEEERPYLFKPFHRSAEARRRGVAGIGLGLAVAARIAEAFHATIDVASELGKGSRFTVRLPLAIATETAASPAPAKVEETAAAAAP